MEEKKKENPTSPEKREKKRSNKLLFILLTLALILLGLGILGKVLYRKLASAFLSKLTGGVVSVDSGGKKLTIQGEGGQLSFEEGGKLPAGFPSDFPIYPGAKLTGSWTAKGEKGEGISLVWETTDDVLKVSDYYKTQLASLGWKVTTTFDSSSSSTFSFEKDSKSGFMGITKSDSKTTISLTLGTK